jgi:hypothetical protein
MVTLLKPNKKNIIALTELIKEQKRILSLTPEDHYLNNIIKTNERTLEYFTSIVKK